MNKVPDATIIQKVTKQLCNHGMRSPCRIAVAARKGDVTLSGTIQFEHQRMAALHATRGVEGVRRVMDQLKVQAKAIQRIITKRPIAEKLAPTTDKITPAIENAAPAMEKTSPSDAEG
jgi:BON domain